MPWTVMAIRALVDSVEVSIAEWKVRHNPQRYLGHTRAGDAFPEFLVLWALFPIVFFSFSGSKLPGYILPSIPPLTILTADYLNRSRRNGLPRWLLWAHAVTCGFLVFVLALAPQHMKYETLIPSTQWLLIAGAAAFIFGAAVFLTIHRWGIPQVCNVTLLPILAMLVFLLGFYGKELDVNYSARPLAREIQQQAPNVMLVATDQIPGSTASAIKRDMDYGLAFYRNQPLVHYSTDGVPAAEHLLVIRANDDAELNRWLAGRVYKPLFLYESQGLEVYRVYAQP
jgi:4-amino-4-deoxy-L-arabinose transferase-like glycosyltransferase